MPGSILGNPVKRTEDPSLITGASAYVDDIAVEGALWAVFVRSPLAHAKIGSVDAEAARSMPGVEAVLVASDLELAPMAGSPMAPPSTARPPLATETVRFVGDIVAVVLADTKAHASDAGEEVFVDYDPLDAVTDPEAALADGAPVLFADVGSNAVGELDFGADPDIFEGAEVVVQGRFLNQRLAAAPMEPNGVVVAPEDGGLVMWAACQNPHEVREAIAGAIGMPADDLHVIAPAVGGGFGAKATIYPEQAICAAAVRKLGKPVRWTETRSENMVAMSQGRAQVQDVEIGAKKDGELVALRVAIVQDVGAYPNMGAILPFLTRQMATGVYRFGKVELKATSVTTNTTPIAAYRGAGRPEAAALLERAIDMLAAELEMDPAELRRKNFIPPDAFPYETPTGATYDTGEYAKALDAALEAIDYEELRREQAERRERGDRIQLGIGLSSFLEVSGLGPAGSTEFGSAAVSEDGTITVLSGSSSHGQGHRTVFAQIAAELFDVPIERVNVIQSDTKLVPRGIGTYGSRSLQLGGTAVHNASNAVIEKAKTLAAHLLEASSEDIVVSDGKVGVTGVPGKALGWDELATAAADASKLPEGMEPGLESGGDFDQGATSYPFGAHACAVEVDTETGEVRFRKYVSVDDCGVMVNPMLVQGQVHGGLAQGIAQALWEHVTYDETGNPMNGNLSTYGVPSAAELPSFDTISMQTPTPLNPLGAKGIGELATVGSTPAVQNAVVDALAHLGVRHIDLPLSPERIWQTIEEAGGGS